MQAHLADLRSEAPDSDPAWLQAVARDDVSAARTPRERALWRYARKLTLEPSRVGPTDLDELRALGLADEDLLDLVQVIAYFNYVNRLADALGVPNEPEWPATDRQT